MSMMRFLLQVALATSLLLDHVTSDGIDLEVEQAAQDFLKEYGTNASVIFVENSRISWIADTNITDYNTQQVVEMEDRVAAFKKEMRQKALQFNASLTSEDTRRQLKFIKDIGVDGLSDVKKLDELKRLNSEMQSIFNTGKVCFPGHKEKCLPMDPDLTEIMAESRDYDKLKMVWTAWRNATGKKMKESFTKYVQISNEAVRQLGYKDNGDNWRDSYESSTFEDDVMALFQQIRPLYEQLHAYVRRKLKEQYGEDKFPKSGHIPAHLLGNMWAQHWGTILDLVLPYENKTSAHITEAMKDQNYTVIRMYKTAEDFYESIGFDPMVPTFWNLSMLERPTDGREVSCHGSAWDMHDGKDFRIKMCTAVTTEDFKTVHHEMGHIQYYMHYKDQPYVYRSAANPGFHEAVGDTMALSVETPEHLYKLGLSDTPPEETDPESDINYLMSMALQKVAFLPFGYLIDLWRWSVFRGDTRPENYNRDWWKLRCDYQGLSPPVPRSEDDFDPGAKYHVPHDTPYIRYFVSFIIQFQFHKAACDAAGYQGPYHRCDIYNSTEAGDLIGGMLKMGISRPWPEAMKYVTGQEKMDAGPLLDYFKPLLEFLIQENGNDTGWDSECPEGLIIQGHAKANVKGNQGDENDGDFGERLQISSLYVFMLGLICLLYNIL